jgi:iron complex outermembrane receptor protein
MINYDRIEIIKGPAASIAGAAESAGYVNFISKRPLCADQSFADLEIGSFNFVRATLDSTGAVPDTPLAYRVTAAYTNSDTWRDNEVIKKISINPSLLWRIGKDTQLLLSVEYNNDLTPSGYGEPFLAGSGPQGGPAAIVVPPGVTPRINQNTWAPMSVNTSGYAGMGWTVDTDAIFLSFIHRFNDEFAFRQVIMEVSQHNDYYAAQNPGEFYYGPNGDLYDSPSDATRQITDTRTYRFQGDLTGQEQWFHDMIGGRLLIGYEYARTSTDYVETDGLTAPFDIVAPDYNTPFITPLAETVNNFTKGGSLGLFGNLQISGLSDRIIVTLGERSDMNLATYTRDNFNNGAITNAEASPSIKSPVYGITVKPLKWLAIYAVKSDAGAATSQLAIYPQIPYTDPRQKIVSITPKQENKEVGAKTTFLNGDFSINIAHYKIVATDAVLNVTDPSVPGGVEWLVTNGNTVNGTELEFSGSLTNRFSLTGGYAYLSTQQAGYGPNGNHLELRSMPRNKVQLFAKYDLSKNKNSGFALKAGVVSEASMWGNTANNYKVPGATRVDAGVDYHRGLWSGGIFAQNLTNIIFCEAVAGPASNTVDAPRTVYFSVARRF